MQCVVACYQVLVVYGLETLQFSVLSFLKGALQHKKHSFSGNSGGAGPNTLLRSICIPFVRRWPGKLLSAALRALEGRRLVFELGSARLIPLTSSFFKSVNSSRLDQAPVSLSAI